MFAVVLGFVGTPAWPWFEGYLSGHPVAVDFGRVGHALPLMAGSTVVVAAGMTAGWWLYGRKTRREASALDVLEIRYPR